VHEPTDEGEAGDRYLVDYSATSGKSTQWTNVYGGPFGNPDMRDNDQQCLTYTSGPLDRPVEVTGHPVAHLWVSSTADDGDFHVYLEQVSPDGRSTHVTEGALRAWHRRTAAAPYEYLGLPYHRHFEADAAEIGDDPVELVFDLAPVSQVFPAGARIRVTIACTEADNAPAPVLDSAPLVTVHRSAVHRSFVEIPADVSRLWSAP
jgi:putative CocE/NonD family hydrolase